MDQDPESLPSQMIIDTPTNADSEGNKDIVSLQPVLDNESQDLINHNDESKQLNVAHVDKNQNPSTEELNIMNQENEAFDKTKDHTKDHSNFDALSTEKSGKENDSIENSMKVMDTNEGCDLTTSQSQPTEDEQDGSIYSVKWVQFNKSMCGIISQSSNGPCPLLAIVNVLLLRGKLSLPEGCQVISAEQLLEYLADLLISLSPNNQNSLPDFQHNMNDAIAILPKLQTGLDVNVKFTGVTDFEYTPECIIFDLLNIPLYHGWLVDPQLEETMMAVNSLSYNQLVESIITNRSSDDSAKVSASLVAQQFLEESASQLTYHGLCELNSVMKEGQLAVFFRNNHFSTMYKQGASLYLLVTDQGFLNNIDVVWETLENIEGDTVFVNHQLSPVQPDSGAGAGGGSPDGDHLLAMSLQQADEAQRHKEREWQDFKEKHLGDTEGLSDSELAARLQEAENAAAEEERQGGAEGGGHRAVQGQGIGPRNNKDKKCCIL